MRKCIHCIGILPRLITAAVIMIIGFNAAAQSVKPVTTSFKTFCNPINLPYNFQSPGATRREAADPVIVLYKDKYWLFASKQQGYWFSDDMLSWNFVKPEGLPLDVYAPSVTMVNGKLCYTAAGNNGTYTTDDPFKGEWTNINRYALGSADPALFQDDDGKVYLYDGCSDRTPLKVTELDPETFLPKETGRPVIYADTQHHGWEVTGEDNRGKNAPWIKVLL